jgi:hypothetical protein
MLAPKEPSTVSCDDGTVEFNCQHIESDYIRTKLGELYLSKLSH